MTESRTLRCYGYVKGSYARVREILRAHPLEVLQRATTSAAARAGAIVPQLHVKEAGIEVGVDVRLFVRGIHEDEGIAGLTAVTSLEFEWEASRTPALFPSMRLTLSAWPAQGDETKLELVGDYRPPFGVLGETVDAVVGRSVAEPTVHDFLEDATAQIVCELATS
jgi:hypothetical protein